MLKTLHFIPAKNEIVSSGLQLREIINAKNILFHEFIRLLHPILFY